MKSYPRLVAQTLASLALTAVLCVALNHLATAQTLNIVTKTAIVQINTADIDSATVQTTTFTIIKKDKTTQILNIADIVRMTFTLATSVANAASISNNAALSGLLELVKAYPNPANAGTAVEYELSQTSTVTAQILDAAGMLIKTLTMRLQQAGRHELRWDATNDAGLTAPSGSYTCVIRAGGAMLTQKIIIIR